MATPHLQRTSSRPRAASAPPTATVCGAWEVAELLGRGHWCEVLAARPAHSTGPCLYALKRLLPEWCDNELAVATLRCEAELGRQVSNRHVISILDSSLRAAPFFLVMPRLWGATWAQRLSAGEKTSLPVNLWRARQVAEGLSALHSQGYLHGDIKPSNLWISDQSHVTLLDLGFARTQQQAASVHDRCFVGTLLYAAPETLVSAFRPDVRSDIYSLGVTLYEVLAGRLPYEALDAGELINLQRSTQPPPLRVLAPHIPTSVARLVHSMLAHDPIRRPQNPAELIESLLQLEVATFRQHADWESTVVKVAPDKLFDTQTPPGPNGLTEGAVVAGS
jgi:serine/threonine-protein kinase